MLEWNELCTRLFPEGHMVTQQGEVLSGTGRIDGQTIAVIGVTSHAAIGATMALELSEHVLDVLNNYPQRAILMLVDTQGQRLSRFDELVGNNGYLAHLAKCFAVARQRGHQLISVVYSEAVSGGFLSLGMIADDTYAVRGAQIRVMALPAMSRITKLPLEELEALCRTSPILGPGVENYIALGGVESIWDEPLDACLRAALRRPSGPDVRCEEGAARGGRSTAAMIARRIVDLQV